jgi:hypothetical protein
LVYVAMWGVAVVRGMRALIFFLWWIIGDFGKGIVDIRFVDILIYNQFHLGNHVSVPLHRHCKFPSNNIFSRQEIASICKVCFNGSTPGGEVDGRSIVKLLNKLEHAKVHCERGSLWRRGKEAKLDEMSSWRARANLDLLNT